MYMYMYVYIYIYIYIYILHLRQDPWPLEEAPAAGRAPEVSPRKGGCYGWKPSSSSNFSIRAFRTRVVEFELFEPILLCAPKVSPDRPDRPDRKAGECRGPHS